MAESKKAKQKKSGARSFTVTTADGKSYAFDVTTDEPTVRPGRVTRTAKQSQTGGFAGTEETRSVGMISVTVFDRGNFRIRDIDDWDDVTGVLVLNNGKQFTAEGAATGDPPELNVNAGTFVIQIEGNVEEDVFE